MTLQSISKVNISLNTSGISRAGFGTPMFITAHNYFTDRVRSYTGSVAVGEDMTTESNGYAAALATFKNSPSVDNLKIGRLIASSLISPVGTGDGGAVETGITYTITVTDVDDVEVVASYTTLGGDALSDIVTALVSQINAGSLDLTVTNNGDTFSLSRPSAFPVSDFVISDIVNSTVTAIDDGNTEDILVAKAAIQEVDNDWYAAAWENHTDVADVLRLADALEAEIKLFFTSSSHESSINDPYSVGDTPTDADDLLAYLADGGYARTVSFWHQDADTDFPELTFAGYNLPYNAGSVVWANLQLPISNSKNEDGNALTTTQEQNLANRYANFASIKGGIVYSREGKVVGNEWIDNIRGRDNLQADLEADIFDILTNQQGKKVPFTDKGINIIVGRINTRLNFYKDTRNFLTDPIVMVVPKARDIPQNEKVTRILSGLSFTAKLSGGIQMVDLEGTLEV